jgi:ribonucleoside-diphosphate reductase alpha chain
MDMQNTYISGTQLMSFPEIVNYKVKKRKGAIVKLELAKIEATIVRAAQNLPEVNISDILKEVVKNIFDGISSQELEKAFVLSTTIFIERDPSYDILATRLLLQKITKEVTGLSQANQELLEKNYRRAFVHNIQIGVQQGLFDKRLLLFDLEMLAEKLQPKRDDLFRYMGLHTLYERYFARVNNRRIETPQAYWMRVALGLSLQEENMHERALEFYELLSTLRYIPSTPTLFHAGFPVAQLSSCFLNTVNDDLSHIFKFIGDNAQLAKWAGGIGSDWTNIRGTGAYIKSIKATSQGVIPFLKIANDVVVAITKSGIRRGGTCVYLETWHWDIEEFLDLRRNTGDERRRTHDMNTANWIPDLFMKRVQEDSNWTLFSPEEVPDLHDLYGKAFEERYCFYEEQAQKGIIKQFKYISAKQLWRKMLTRLFETGHPWITFKDPCNIRSPQDHVGVVHSSNLCTEITLNTSEQETAVCNLGSVNLMHHIKDGFINEVLLEQTIKTAIRMLDNVIDLNFYPTQEARESNMRHRPIGLGLMGLQDALFMLDIPFSSQAAIQFSDVLMERISFYAIRASCLLAQERGAYESFKNSKWDRGIFPLDTINLLEQERGLSIDVSRTATLDWAPLKELVKQYGMRHSNTMAIAPTATISTIAGCYPCIEPIYENIYVESNVSGEFTIVNKYLVQDLKKIGLWHKSFLDQLKYHDGDLTFIKEVPQYLKDKYKTAFEIDPEHLISISAARAKWIDQSQSHNVFSKGLSGSKLSDIYIKAWKSGLKTTYYLRTLGATQIEKSTLDAKTFGFTQKRNTGNACGINAPADCESCQ